MYKERFQEAIKRTERLNLELPKITINNEQYVTNELLEEIPHLLKKEFGEFDIEDLAGQCLSMNLKLKDTISNYLNIPIYYTIGYITYKENNYFKQTEESLIEMIKNKNYTGKVSLHSWLTLPSMEILDSTFLTSFSLVNNFKEGIGGMILTHADDVKHMEFIPMLVGSDYIKKAELFKLEFFEIK
jgi:hypothetical protein